MWKYLASVVAAFSGLVGFACASQAQLFANSKLYVGVLSCNVSGSVGLIFGSSKDLNCILVRSDGTSELYRGSIKRFGIDIGFTKATHVLWHVYSLAESAPAGAVAGDYASTQASLAVGVSAGSNALIGGNNGSMILQSVALQGSNAGVNFADGIAEISLRTTSY
jgi:hypothetical protein